MAAVLRSLDDEIRSAFIAEQDRLVGARRDGNGSSTSQTGVATWSRFLVAERDRRTGGDTETAELDRQRAASKIQQWVDKQTGMMHTHVELDPVRGAKLKKAIR